jgi:cell division protein FtsZ
MTVHSIGVAGIGTAGKRVVEKVSFSFSDAVCVTLDDSEWKVLGDKVHEIYLSLNLDRSTGNIKKIAWNTADKVSQSFKGLDNAVVVVGLGGMVGSSAAPIVAQRIKEDGKKVFGVVIMPFKFEKNKLFRAAVGLKKMKMICDGIVIIDNEDFIEKAPQTPLLKAFEMENDWISKFISSFLSGKERFGLNGNEVYEFTSTNKNNILAIGRAEGSSMAEEATFKVSSSLRRQSKSNVKGALMCVVGWKDLSVGDFSTIVSTFRGTTMCDGEVKTGYYTSGERNLTVYALASVERTRFDDWDPLSAILGDKELDFDPYCDMKLDGADCSKICRID